MSEEFLSIFQVPAVAGETESSGVFISLIDASGSMRPFWNAVAQLFNEYTPNENAHTITFSGSSKIEKSNRLRPDLSYHGGGLTNIPAAFASLDKILGSVDQGTPVTVLFISDGQDNNLRTLPDRLSKLKGHQGRRITFLCLGIQSGFPTFLSMTLRDLYHNTQSSIPALFLIEYFTEAALRNKFEAMKEFFQLRKKVKVSPPVKEFPWSFEESDALYEGTWVVLSDQDLEGAQLVVGDQEFDLRKHPPTIDLVLQVFRAYVQEMQMLSLSKTEFLIEQAGEALRVMRTLVDYFQETKGIDLLKEYKLIGTLDATEVQEEVEQLMHLDFQQRVEFNKLRHNQFRIKGYFDNIELLAKGLGVEQLSEWEAAKRIGIGTITGNYHQRALNLRGLTVDDFRIIRNEFLETYKQIPISDKPSEQEESVITLENQKDVFLDPEFEKGLAACSSQFDLVETFPVVGLALKVKRPQGLDINSWLIDVRDIAKHNKQMDSFSLLKSDFRMELSTGSNEKELINAVLPVFTLKDGDMQPLLSHKLFALLMTFVVQKNIDTLDPFAYLALLGNTWLFLLNSPDSEYKSEMCHSILETIQLVYGQNEESNQFKRSIVEAPVQTIFGQSADLSKIICYVMLLHFSDSISDEQRKSLLGFVFIKYFKSLPESWQSYVAVDSVSMESVLQSATDCCEKEFDQFSTASVLAARFDSICSDTLKNCDELKNASISLKRSKFQVKGEKITLSTLVNLARMVMGADPSDDQLLQWLYLSGATAKCEVSESLKESPEDTVKEVKDVLLSNPDAMFQAMQAEALQELKKKFISKFQAEHVRVLPLSASEVVELCGEKEINPKTLEYDASINMVRNACMARNCPFFLRTDIELAKHLGTWQDKCPRAFHKLVKENHSISPEEILKKLEAGEGQAYPRVKKDLSELYPSDKDQALKYISLVSNAYQQIKTDDPSVDQLSVYVPRKNSLWGKKHRGKRSKRSKRNRRSVFTEKRM